MVEMTRREALETLAAGAAGLFTIGAAGAAPPDAAASVPPRRPHAPRPLPFDPAQLKGLSEKLLRSHWENNYQGSVKTLNLIDARLAEALAAPDFPAAVYGGLKREELHRLGSVVLHEHYFANLGGDGKPGGAIAKALKATWGSLQAWETDFRRTAMSLAGGSGWVVLSWNAYTGELRNHWAWDHMHAAPGATPLLVLDMYEHAYHMDYGSAAAKYVDAAFANWNWAEVDRRYRLATGVTKADAAG